GLRFQAARGNRQEPGPEPLHTLKPEKSKNGDRDSVKSRAIKVRLTGSADFGFRVSVFVCLRMLGCGAPGEPVPPSPPVPAAIKNLAARQAGDGVELTFT